MAKSTIVLGILISQSISLIFTVKAQNENWGGQRNSDCRTPTNIPGLCTPIRQCQPVLNILLQPTLSPDARRFLKQSKCGTGTNKINPTICCPIAVTEDPDPTVETDSQNLSLSVNNNPYLPKDCGRDLSSRILGGEKTTLFEFPWMVLLEYTKPNGKTTACGGVLVSSRYVLTAAHCLKGRNLMKSWRLSGVRLGEYDTSTDRDCVPDGENLVICSDDPVTVLVEEQIVHESYQPYSKDQRHDVALIRLATNVRFTNYIKPICLPTSGVLSQRLWVAGWGKTENKSESSVKLKLAISPADPTACSQRYKHVGISLGQSQLCAGGERGKDSCRGDSGGPLMLPERTSEGKIRWAVVGIVSFGPNPCGMENWPGIYTKIADYVPWILTKLRA